MAPVNMDSIYLSLESAQQQRIIRNAITLARTAKTFVSTSKINIISRTKRLRKYEIEWHLKFTLSFACFIFFFIGAPLGAIVRKGGLGMPAVISTLFFLMYHVLSTTGRKAAIEGLVGVPSGIWFSSFLLLPLGILLTYKATRDSVLMNIDSYLELPKKILKFLGLENLFVNGTSKTSHEDIDPGQ
jgi:lipopolysaccharide export system permease protein